MAKNGNISTSVIKRLPRYYRFLGELEKQGVERISSRELSERMKLTASQIRQRGLAGEYQADEWAGIARTSWRLSVR